ncbi:MAG: hypothetical protein KME26_32310 [Oscillatoria princeps RMCB-10]|nr:hypothetical protein [Oscillatoria princeps RMCB-10]
MAGRAHPSPVDWNARSVSAGALPLSRLLPWRSLTPALSNTSGRKLSWPNPQRFQQ